MYAEGSSHLLCIIAEGGGNDAVICSCLTRKSEALVDVGTLTFYGRFGNESIMLFATVHAWVLFDSNSSPICTSTSAFIVTSTIFLDLSVIFVCLARRTRCGACSSFVVIMSCVLSYMYVGSSGRSNMTSISTLLEIQGSIFCSKEGFNPKSCRWMRCGEKLVPSGDVQRRNLLQL